MTPRVSVVIPTYRRNASLCKTLQTLFEQDSKEFEIVVVDQKPDHDAETTSFIERSRHLMRYITKDHANLPAARNTGIKESQGDIIVFSDDDMELPRNTITELLRGYDDPKVFGLSGFVISRTEENDFVEVTHAALYAKRHLYPRLIEVEGFRGSFMSYRRELFNKVGMFDEWIGEQPTAAGEESELCFRARQAGLGLYLLPGLILTQNEFLPGGCGKTDYSNQEKTNHSVKMAFYAYIKNRPSDSALGYARATFRCYRAWVLNRSILNLNPMFHWRRHHTFFRALRFALDSTRRPAPVLVDQRSGQR